MKKTILPILTLAATLACGSAAAAEGDIWQIWPCDRYGQNITSPSGSPENTVAAGSNIYFKVRLVSKGDDYTPYHIAGTGATSTNTSINPPRICLYVSGQPTFADYIGEIEYGAHFTDVIFRYTPQVGDYAMPVKLGTATGPASDLYKEDIAYYFDPLTSWMWEWTSKNKTDPVETPSVANWWFFNGDPAPRGETGRTTGLDYSLANCRYYIKTVGFDSEWESETVWRSVHKGSDTIKVGSTPSLVATAKLAEQKVFYVWSEDDEIVKVSGPNASPREVRPGVWRNVATVVMDGGQESQKFEIWGVTEFQSTKLVMSAYPKYNISDATGAIEEDYLTVPVYCAEVLPPTIRIVPETTKVVASSTYTYYVTELNVTFTQPYSQDVTLTVTPSLEAGVDLDWKDYLAIYSEKTLDIAVAAATNTVYTIPAGSTVPMENGAQKRIYLFALRGDENTINTKHVQFTASTENLQAHADITGWDTPTGLLNIVPEAPVIVEPAEGDDSLTAVAGNDRTLRIKVDSMYADQNVVSNGYQIFIIKNTDTETAYEPIGGADARYVPGNGGYLYLTNAAGKASDKLPTVRYSVTDPELNKSVIYVKSPISTLESAERHFSVKVSAPAGYTVNVIDDAGVVIPVPSLKEGDSGTIQVKLDRANDTGTSLYAFLKPANDDAKNAIQCGFLAVDDNYGLEIQPYSTGAADGFVMIDGRDAANSSFKYTVELRTAPLYQDGVPVTSYQCKNTLVIKSSNVIPEIEKVYLGLDETQLVDGKWMFPELVIAKGIKQTFTAGVLEPGLADLMATGDKAFKTRWRFSTSGVGTKAPDNADDPVAGVILGDPETHKAEFTFTKAGEWKVIVDCQDKDMSTFGNKELKQTFTFYVTVVDQPAITVSAHYLSGSSVSEEVAGFDETDSTEMEGNACVNVALGFNKCDFPLIVQLTVTDPGAANPGVFLLQESTNVRYMGGGIYQVTFAPGETSVVIPVKSLDGTKLSKAPGFLLETKMLTDEPCPETGDPAQSTKDYYVGASKYVKVSNVDPVVDEFVDIDPRPMTTNMTSVGEANTISWDISDVPGDFANDVKGIVVTVKSEGATVYTTELTDSSQSSGSWNGLKFVESGVKYVTLSFKDKDGKDVKFTLIYDVAASKTLSVLPHGPLNGLSGLYKSGYGEGRVYAAGLSGAKSEAATTAFKHVFNCGLDKAWYLFGYGYKVGDVEGQSFHYPYTSVDGELTGYNDDRDILIDASGKGSATGGYAYSNTGRNVDAYGKPADSFLYAWVMKSTEEKAASGAYSVLAYKPEAPYAKDAGTEVALPTEQLDDGSYALTTVEGVFSLEYLWSDNMGDINADGIPDAWFHNLSFTESKEVVNVATGVAGTEESAVNDTVSVAAYNTDEDFLPELTLNGQAYLLDYSGNRKFTARLELRGYGEHLNDAPNNNVFTRLTGFKPERRYLDPEVEGNDSTLSKLEYLAWQEYAAANSLDVNSPADWEKWSPENPTDPTKADTDDDGIDDGVEYAFWYRAHVGFYDETTKMHTYLTGRRFDPKNPGEGTFISSAEIEKAMNPTVPFDEAVATRDSDNDGLPDIIEVTVLGTNPFDFDTDGDGVPDGYEVLVAGTDPCKPATYGTPDGGRNVDGDHMAWTTVYHVGGEIKDAQDNDCGEYLLAKEEGRPIDSIVYYTTFALKDENGDTDGVQWYAVPEATEVKTEISEEPVGKALLFAYYTGEGTITDEKSWVKAMTTRASIPVVAQDDIGGKTGLSRLAADLTKEEVFLYEEPAEGETALVIGAPVRVPRGAVLVFDATQEPADYYERTLSEDLEDKVCNTAWPYGTEKKAVLKVQDGAPQQVLALGRNQKAPKGKRVVAAPLATRPVALLHYYVYQAYGFDPRTAWSSTTPLAKRWGRSVTTGGESQIVEGKSNLAGMSTRTRPYTTRDECLVMSFLLNADCIKAGDLMASAKKPWADLFLSYTTNPRGPGETTVKKVDASGEETAAAETEEGASDKDELPDETVGDNGADTDEDGVPDGWELYVMAGPKADGKFTKVSFADGSATDLLSPWKPSAASITDTDVPGVMKLDNDNMTEWQEFAGTDSVAAYTNVSATITRPVEHEKWINKFFPTDPWNADTDGDGMSDSFEFNGSSVYFKAANFIYGTPEDDDNLMSIPGGGLNPCSVDTDRDGLPDTWEAQFAGSKVYDGEFKDDARLQTGNTKSGNPRWGLVDGMDGTVADAYTQPNHKEVTKSFESGDGLTNTIERLVTPNRDYDHDGLENWQEYMVGAMRCWRYDDPYTRWDALPGNVYTNENGVLDIEKVCAAFGFADENEFWFRTLADKTSPYYNPRFVFDTNPGAVYWSRVTNAWDVAYNTVDGGSYYIFYHRSGADHLKDLWGKGMGLDETPFNQFPQRYASCSPIEADTDQDGMDDYYELFHGLNPLLGLSGVRKVDGGPYDVIYDVWYKNAVGSPHSAEKNWWTGKATLRMPQGEMDFVAYPFLAGSAAADPDGDDIRNQEEALMPETATATWHHTDPTPLWMTDASYSNSLVRLFGQMPANPMMFSAPEGNFKSVVPEGSEDDPVTLFFRDFDAYLCMDTDMGQMRFYAPSRPDHWCASDYMKPSWLFSFEENEGFDSDHDGIGDREELEGKFRTASDPIHHDSPRRRQAMYFQGPARPSLLMTMPQVKEKSPDLGEEYPDDPSFLQYTVECWAYPETADDATVVERAVWAAPSSLADQELLRCNFQLAVKNGKWYTKYDARGTERGNKVELFSRRAIEVNAWTHLAATYDGKTLRLYVNGTEVAFGDSSVQPEYGVSALALKANRTYAFDREYPLHAILVGASAKTQAEGALDGLHLSLTANPEGYACYTRWFKGYIDEIRIWDGARSAAQVSGAMATRFTAELAAENRKTFYGQWATVDTTYPNGRRRYVKDAKGVDCEVEPELRYHYCFDSVPAAENEKMVAKEPHGFGVNGVKTPVSRPDGYTIAWWSDVLAAYANTVYANPQWVTWVPNTVTHLPRFDGTTLDSLYWSEDFKGDLKGTYKFARTAEPVSLWTQMTMQRVMLLDQPTGGESYMSQDMAYRTAGTRHHLVNSESDLASKLNLLFAFTGRHLNQSGDDLLPLGGAYVKYCDNEVGLWDGQGASTTWEVTGNDADNDGLPDWWEVYADENYRIGDKPFTSLDWDTLVNYHGNVMAAGDAYLRDLAKGLYANGYGEVVEGPTKYRQTYDQNANGIPDWWEDLYHLTDQNPLADSDNDGLPNYLEYMLSEIFDFGGRIFSPRSPYSVDEHVTDYFFRIGSLYLGEIFTDHDLTLDAWEDLYSEDSVSRLKYDAFVDADGDGWTNRSEDRAGTDPSKAVHAGLDDAVIADYPVPLIRAKINVPKNVDASAPIVIQAFRTSDFSAPDAVWQTSSEADSTKTRAIGTNPGGTRHYFLSPGYTKPGSLSIEFQDGSAEVYELANNQLTSSYFTNSGWKEVVTDRLRPDNGIIGDLVSRDDVVGWINYETGEIMIEFDSENLREVGFVTTTTTTSTLGGFSSAETETVYTFMNLLTSSVRFTWESSLVESGVSAALYLSNADSGHVREGLNTFVAFVDLGSPNGVWDVGEPFGIVRDVDVSWSGTAVDIELTDVSPVTPRVDLVNDTSDRVLKRADLYAKMRNDILAQYADQPLMISNLFKRLEWQDGNRIVDKALAAANHEPVRVRVVRWLVNDIPVYAAGASMRVVYDKTIATDVKTTLTEADILSDGGFDLDWANLRSEIIDNGSVREACGGQVTSMTYLVVVGDGPAEWHATKADGYEVSALTTLIRREFTASRTTPKALSPGDDNQIVMSASPTFRWSIDGDELAGYTAFKVQVKNAAKELVYDSGLQPMPPRVRDNAGNVSYSWQAPLCVGDKTTLGKVFANHTNYTWQVSAYNAKFTSDAFSTPRSFFLNVQENGYATGKANVAVKYFGPKRVWSRGETVRVQAFTSPDFTGKPAAAGFVAAPDDAETGLNVTGKVVRANCTVIGLPPGQYYMRAFIDSNGNGVCDTWESQGYFCHRDGSTADYLNPVAVTVDTKVGNADLLTIYLEDSDTDMDGLPDAWEYAMYGNLTTRGVELLSMTSAGEFAVNQELSGKLEALGDVAGGLAAHVRTALAALGSSTAGVALVAGVDEADVLPTDGGLVVKSEVDPETLTIVGFAVDAAKNRVVLKVGAETTANVDAVVANFLNITVRKGAEVTVRVERAESPAGPWTVVPGVGGTVTVDRAGADIEVKLNGELPAQGYFRATIAE